MSKDQSHGKTIETFVRGGGQFHLSQNRPGRPGTPFDIDGDCDSKLGIPTSVKATSGGKVDLADARRIWDITERFRMVVAEWRQEGEDKVIHAIHEFLIETEEMDKLRKGISAETVSSIHEEIRSYRKGEHFPARTAAKKALVAAGAGRGQRRDGIRLNPKIDSENQRRLQCSVTLSTLMGVCKTWKTHTDKAFGTEDGKPSLRLPHRIGSTPREFG